MEAQTRPLRLKRLPWREIDGRVVVVQTGQGEVHELNPTASFLWSQADGTRTVSELARLLASQFEIGETEAESDTMSFFSDLEARRLLAES